MPLLGKSSSFVKIMKIERINILNGFPVKPEELRDHLRLATGDFDNILELHLKAAIASAEEFTGLVLRRGNFQLAGNFSHEIKTDIMPISEIVSVSLDGKEVGKGCVEIEDSVLRFPDGMHGEKVKLEFIAGFAEIPSDIAAAILLIASRFFENPADSVEQLPKASTNLLRPHKKWGR